jgi:RNA polymerase sigma-70 factor, ECF subfamily
VKSWQELEWAGKAAVSDLRAGEVTELLRAWHAGDDDAYARVSAMLYDELRSRAAQYMHCQRAGDSLQATALVHEAFLRLHDARQVDWHDRNHFLAVAARTMRRVLVDLARAKASAKRGGRPQYVTLDLDIAAPEPEHAPLDLIALDAALEALGAVDPRKLRVVELRFFAGLSVEETAAVVGVSQDTVARDWRMARSWLLNYLDAGSESR